MPEPPLRLEAAPHFRPPHLGDLGDDLRVVDGGKLQTLAVYWDTPDLRLARWGAKLIHADGEGWRVWQPAPADGAVPVEGIVLEGEPERPPEEAIDLLRGYIRGSELTAVARVRRVRRTVVIRDADDHELLRVLSDEISVLDGRRVAVRYRQIVLAPSEMAEIALVHGVLTRLRAAGAGGPDTTDEHARVLGPAAAEPAEVSAPPLGPESTLHDAVKAMVASSVTRLLRHDAGVRAGDDPEAVHQARVATRRLRSDLDTFGEVLEPEPLRRLRAELKWLAALLGEVRDTDVLISRMSARLTEVAASAGGRTALLQTLTDRRADARRKMLAGMRGPRYIRLLDALVEFARAPQLRAAGDQPARDVLPELAAGPWRRLEKTVDKVGRHPPDDDLHAVRIAAKRSRYAAEAAAPVVGKPATRFAEAVAALQEVLGDFNDAVVARHWLAGVAPGLDPAGAFLAGVLSERERASGAASVRGWRKGWKRLQQGKLQRWMPDA